MRHAFAEGWLLLRQRMVISLVLAVTLAIPISLAGTGLAGYRWLRPLAAGSDQPGTVAVLLHPRLDHQQRLRWIEDRAKAHPEWQIREVSERDLVLRLGRWFPSLDELLVDELASLPPLVEISTTTPETVAELEGDEAVLAIGPLTSIERIVKSVASRTAVIVAVLSGLLLAGAVMLSGVWVHLELYRHASELTIMRLVGATESTIRGPFLVAVGAPGLVAAGLSVVVTVLTVSSLGRAASALGLPMVTMPPWVCIAQALTAWVLPLAAAAVTLARHAAEAEG